MFWRRSVCTGPWPYTLGRLICMYGAVCIDKKKIEGRKNFFVGHVMYRHTCNLGLLSDLCHHLTCMNYPDLVVHSMRQKSWSSRSVSCVAALNCQMSSLGTRPRYSLVVDEDVKKPNKQAHTSMGILPKASKAS